MDKEFRIEVLNIKMCNFHLDERSFDMLAKTEFSMSSRAISVDKTARVISVVAIAMLKHVGKPDALSSIVVETTFNTSGYEIQNGLIKVPEEAALIMVSLAFSHVRPLWLQLLNKTAYENKVLPIFKPFNLARQVFPESFSNFPNPQHN